jgi:hypothetical protein
MVTSLGGYHRFADAGSCAANCKRFSLFRGKSFANLRKDLHTRTHPWGICTG